MFITLLFCPMCTSILVFVYIYTHLFTPLYENEQFEGENKSMETTKYLTRLLSGVFKMALLNFCSSNFFFVAGDHHSLKIFILFKLKYFQNVTKTIIKTLEVRGCLLSFWKQVFVGLLHNNVVYFDQLSGVRSFFSFSAIFGDFICTPSRVQPAFGCRPAFKK